MTTEGSPKPKETKNKGLFPREIIDKSCYLSSAAWALAGALTMAAPIENPALTDQVRQILNILTPASLSVSAFFFLLQQLEDVGLTLGGEKTEKSKSSNPPTST